MKKLLLTTAIISSLSGCATIFTGSETSVRVKPVGVQGGYSNIECKVENANSTEYAQGRNDRVFVDRDSSDLDIFCESPYQEGSATVESDFRQSWLVLDFLWDLCIFTLSCPIDLATGNFYTYDENVNVEMFNKEGIIIPDRQPILPPYAPAPQQAQPQPVNITITNN